MSMDVCEVSRCIPNLRMQLLERTTGLKLIANTGGLNTQATNQITCWKLAESCQSMSKYVKVYSLLA